MVIESHYQLCEEQEEGKMCICEDIYTAHMESAVDVEIENYYEEYHYE